MKDKMIFKNGVEKKLEAGASLGAIQVLAADKAAMVTTWEQFTEENLSEVQIQTGEGLTVGRYKNLLLVSETSVERPDGSILTTYCLRGKEPVEKRLDILEMGQEVQDGAIEDVAAVTSAMADQIGGV